MNKERLNQLLKYLDQDTEDPFILYAIAIEYKKTEPQQALKYFEQLLSNHQDYLPTYYHAAELLADLGYHDRADQTYKKGIELAGKKEDHNALRELKSAYEEFRFENE